MGNIAIGFSHVNPDVDVTASSAETSAPVSNLRLRDPKKFWQSTSTTSEWVKVDFGSAKTVNAISLAYGLANASSQIQIQANTTDTWLAPPVDIGPIDFLPHSIPSAFGPRYHSWRWETPAETYRWWRILFSGSWPQSYLRVGRWILAEAFQPTVNVQYPYRIWYEQLTEEVGDDPATREEGAPLRRWVEIRMVFQTEAEMMDNLFLLEASRGSAKDVFVVFDPEASTYVLHKFIYGVIDDLGTFELGLGDRWEISLVIKEML